MKWRKRRNNNNPSPSYVKYDIIKEKFPLLLLDFIEKHIHLEETPEIKVQINEDDGKYKK